MAAEVLYDKQADLERLKHKPIAIIGFGSQGHAHAMNLQDSGLDVRVGLYADSKSRAKAEAAGLTVRTVSEAVKEAQVVMILTPDIGQADVYRDEIAPYMEPGKTLMFAHGFNIRFGQIVPDKSIDVSMIAPKGPGHRLREVYVNGGGIPALIAVEQDATGGAFEDAMAYAKGLGCTRAGVLRTTFAEETETDLFGEQAVLCGGVSELIKLGYETLLQAGYQPEVAYFECLHEVKLIVDLLYQGGLNYMNYSVSDTAEFGGYTSGPKVVGEESRKAMQQVLADIQSGAFAEEWIDENHQGRANFYRLRRENSEHPVEIVGRELRRMMPFVNPREVTPGSGGA
ncbi:MAG: ketol-acid reductoisomerase [Chloroflexaceae bacterium]|nr:ketol-acid reductoisomerase [Chloroflexaceae bacterium]